MRYDRTVELLPGVVVGGKLRLTRQLGQGGMGVVWEARHLGLDADVAVKFLRPDLASSRAGHAARFEREAKATARITHPNVVRVMDFGAVDGMPYLVMELLAGFSLAELLERGGRLSFATATALVTQVGAALASAHDEGIVHRDVKPHNVLVTEGSAAHALFVKVLDFGVAKMIERASVPGADAALTETGVIVGSAPYMSPEQIEGRKDVDARADLWSLGVIVYECLTGVRPFDGSSFVTVGAAVLEGKYLPASRLRENLPPGTDDWLAKALAVDPEERFASAREMVAAFVALAAGASGDEAAGTGGLDRRSSPRETSGEIEAPATTSTHAAPPPRSGGRSRVLFGGAITATVAVVAGVLFVVHTRRPESCPAGMVLVEGATFPMGSPAEDETPSDETPLHREKVASYCIDAHEVTVSAYAACRSCERAPMTVAFEGLTPSGLRWESQFCNGGEAFADHPMNCVSFDQAKAYCAAQGKRLPTEPEWELAARGPEGAPYPWGSAAPSSDLLNACGAECSRLLTERRRVAGKDPWPAMFDASDAAETTAPVGSYPKGRTPAGVDDLAGNVWEWTDSTYCAYGDRNCTDSRRVLRGGGWDTTQARDVRASRRFPGAETARGRSIGFRCARSL